ncbi:MAG TPA: hypothetical protein VF400_17205 [Anaeromyxobacteraceae bacterium]
MTAEPRFRAICCAIITSNPLIRGVLTALNWLRKREYSEAIFGDPEVAIAWLQAERGVSLPMLRRTVQGWGRDVPSTNIEDRADRG